MKSQSGLCWAPVVGLRNARTPCGDSLRFEQRPYSELAGAASALVDFAADGAGKLKLKVLRPCTVRHRKRYKIGVV